MFVLVVFVVQQKKRERWVGLQWGLGVCMSACMIALVCVGVLL